MTDNTGLTPVPEDKGVSPASQGPGSRERNPQAVSAADAASIPDAWLSKDDAETELWKAIEGIRLGNKTDDKLILENLRQAGVWLARFKEAS